MIEATIIIVAVLAITGLIGAGLVIGVVFGALILYKKKKEKNKIGRNFNN